MGSPKKTSDGVERDSVAQDSLFSDSFKGNFEHVLDEKGRISVPVEFRQIIQRSPTPSVVVTNFVCDGVRCLEGFLLSEWKSFEERLRARSRFDPQLQKLENFYLSRASECSLDNSGRILIPNYLRTYASLEKEVVFTSSLRGFRLWDRRVWELVFREAESALLENPEIFRDITNWLSEQSCDLCGNFPSVRIKPPGVNTHDECLKRKREFMTGRIVDGSSSSVDPNRGLVLARS